MVEVRIIVCFPFEILPVAHLFAENYSENPEKAIEKYVAAANLAHELGLGINAGHDLSLEKLAFFKSKIPQLLEVSIGHALISDALYFGIENTIQLYLRELNF